MRLPSRDIRRPLLPVSEILAAAQWGAGAAAHGGDDVFDMRYAPDEDSLLTASPRSAWLNTMRASHDYGAELATCYPVDDPYGAERGGPVVASFFGIRVSPEQITFGAGITALLHGLSYIAGDGLVMAPSLVHSDLEVWASSHGATIRFFDEPFAIDDLLEAIEDDQPAVLHLDRPNFLGSTLPIRQLERLARSATSAGTVVVIDEAAATYLGPAFSAARLIPDADNLVVLRGFTKAYSMGGMRVAIALASQNIASHVRDLIPPMQVSELSLRVALRLLSEGDIFAPLRERIHTMMPRVAALFRAAEFDVSAGDRGLPWLAMADPKGAVIHRLAALGIRPLLPTSALAFPDVYHARPIMRVTIPLSTARLKELSTLLSSPLAENDAHVDEAEFA